MKGVQGTYEEMSPRGISKKRVGETCSSIEFKKRVCQTGVLQDVCSRSHLHTSSRRHRRFLRQKLTFQEKCPHSSFAEGSGPFWNRKTKACLTGPVKSFLGSGFKHFLFSPLPGEQMQTQLANLQGSTVPQNFMNMAPQEIAKAFASTASSPQNPNPQKRDPLAPFGVASRSRPREGPYTPQGTDGKDPKEEKKEKTEDEKIAEKIAGMD